MSRKREEYGPTLQERRVPTPEVDLHKKVKRSKRGPYVVTASSFYFLVSGERPTYWWVTHVDALENMKRRSYWKTMEVYGEGENWTHKEATRKRRELERSSRVKD